MQSQTDVSVSRYQRHISIGIYSKTKCNAEKNMYAFCNAQMVLSNSLSSRPVGALSMQMTVQTSGAFGGCIAGQQVNHQIINKTDTL